LENPKVVEKFKAAVPRHLNPERMLRVSALALQKTPKLLECDPMTLLGAMMVCASLGIEPNTPLGHAYLIPFERRQKNDSGRWVTAGVDINLIIGYRGYIDLARRTGMMVSLHADVVYGPAGDMKGDEFSFEYGSNMHLRHVPIGDNEGRPPVWAYAHASLKDGQAFEVLPYERVLKVRDNSEGYRHALRAKERLDNGDRSARRTWESAPWVAFEHEMAAKTMVRRLSKMLPLSIEFANAAALDTMSETGSVDFSSFMDGADMSTIDVTASAIEQDTEPEEQERRRGRPLGSRNKPRHEETEQQQNSEQEDGLPDRAAPNSPRENDDGPPDPSPGGAPPKPQVSFEV